MVGRASPQQKKQASYEKDQRPLLENPHAFRKNWRKKKAEEHRRDRAALRSALARVDADELTAVGAKLVRRHQYPAKSFVMSLRERIAFTLKRRERVGMITRK